MGQCSVMKWLISVLMLLVASLCWGQEFNRSASISNYFWTHNAALAEIPFSQNTPREFSWVRKVTAFERDGWKCVVCGSTNNLEMDHAAALMNGGCNDITNLFALCHTCHVEKTRLDRSLKKHRIGLAKSIGAQP